MKKTLFLILTVTFSHFSFSQAQPEKQLQPIQGAVKALAKAQTFEQISSAANFFERFTHKEPGEWIPFYWLAYCNVRLSYLEGDEIGRDALLDYADKAIAAGIKAAPEESELWALKGMSLQARILVDPEHRREEFSKQSIVALDKSIELDPSNPRAQYLKGYCIFNLGEDDGGGKDNARPFLQKAMSLFETIKVKTTVHPDWGKERLAKLLKEVE